LKGRIFSKRYKDFVKRKSFSYEDIKGFARRDKDFAKVED
jgi:hypothetical protein